MRAEADFDLTGAMPFDQDAEGGEPLMPVLGEFLYAGEGYTAAEFDAFVANYDFGNIPPDFVVLHHTAVPSATWAQFPRGAVWDAGEAGLAEAQIKAKRLRQLDAIRGYYQRTLNWDRGPHLFIDDRYIFHFTPMREIGIHAKEGNSYSDHAGLHYSIGIEVIGYYEHTPWPAAVAANVAAALCALRARLANFRFVSGAGAGLIAEHRMYNKPTCPGAVIVPAFYMPIFEAAWNERQRDDVSLFGPPSATPEQVVAFMLARDHGEYNEHDIAAVIVPAYWRICQAVGIDPVLALAQMIHETANLSSFWSQRPRRNPAGLGVTGQEGVGLSFASWGGEAVPAHVGRLLAYALNDEQAGEPQRVLIAQALAFRPLPATFRGAAPNLAGLQGRWAVPGTGYARKILEIAAAIRKT